MATDSVTGPQLVRTTQTLIAIASPPPQATTTSSSTPSSEATDKSKLRIEDEEEEEEEEEEDEPTCGICLSEGGEGIISRGWIDSCDHYFCFFCIMEWSKLESKCPLCKRRFFSIRRPPKPGVFLSERVVNVPVRDQVYHCFGNASVGPPNLYSDVRCAVCHSGTDESLLLLCDLCDSASHTYCVGLGATVPEGDWFCADCTLLRAERTMNDLQAEADDQSGLYNVKRSSNEEDVSISNIVQDTCTSVVERSYTNNLTFFIPAEEGIGMRDYRNELVSRRQRTTSLAASKLNTRTLSRCHNIHNRIQAFRENWNNYQSGSLSFSSAKVQHGAAAARKPEIGGTSSQQDSLSCLSQPMNGQDGTSNMSHNRGSHDISKAWKMMDIAKSIGRKRTKLLHWTSNRPLKKINVSKEAGDMSLRLPSSLTERHGYQELRCSGPRKHQHNHFLVSENVRHKAQMAGKQKSWDAVKDVPNGEQGLLVTCSSVDCENSYLQEVHLPLQHESSNRVGWKLPKKKMYGDPFTIQNKVGGSACSNSSIATTPVDSNMPCAKPQAQTSPSSSGTNSLDRGLISKSYVIGKSTGDNDAKSEIQSLVKLNLKILTRDKKLGMDSLDDSVSL